MAISNNDVRHRTVWTAVPRNGQHSQREDVHHGRFYRHSAVPAQPGGFQQLFYHSVAFAPFGASLAQPSGMFEHMHTLIYLTYSMMALLYETVPAFEDT